VGWDVEVFEVESYKSIILLEPFKIAGSILKEQKTLLSKLEPTAEFILKAILLSIQLSKQFPKLPLPSKSAATAVAAYVFVSVPLEIYPAISLTLTSVIAMLYFDDKY
jgi:hypothetical protein